MQTRVAERFYLIIVVVALTLASSSLGIFLFTLNQTSMTSQNLAQLSVSYDTAQKVNLQLQALDPNSIDDIIRLQDRMNVLHSSLRDLSVIQTSDSLTQNREADYALGKMIYWTKVVEVQKSTLSLKRANLGIQDATEVVTEVLSEFTASQQVALNNWTTASYIALGVGLVSVLSVAYLIVLMFLAIRGVLTWDVEINQIFASPKADTGRLPEIKIPFATFFPGADLLAKQARQIGNNFNRQWRLEKKLSARNAELSDRLQKTVNELVASREEFARSAQLAAVGKVAGSVSHEINNPVTGVLGYLAFIKKRMNDESMMIYVDKAIREVDRIGRIARSLLVFSRHSATQEPAKFEASAAVENVTTLVAPQMKEFEVTVVVEPFVDVPAVLGRIDELQQCLLNIMLNARYALKGLPERVITVRASRADQFVEISITDTGEGVSPKVIDHLFQPFFTTKPAGEGSGLGLAVAAELMAHMGGSVRYDTGYTNGARFILSVPIWVEPATSAEAATPPAA